MKDVDAASDRQHNAVGKRRIWRASNKHKWSIANSEAAGKKEKHCKAILYIYPVVTEVIAIGASVDRRPPCPNYATHTRAIMAFDVRSFAQDPEYEFRQIHEPSH